MKTRYEISRLQIPACLLCLLIFAGSFDRVPDPPAIKSHGNQTNVISRTTQYAPVTARKHIFDCPDCTPHYRTDRFWFGQIFESREPACRPSFVRRASDVSPPLFS